VSPAEVGRYLDTTRGRPLKGTHSSGPSRVWRNSLWLAGARILNKCVAGRAGSPGYVFSGRRWHRRTPAP